MNIANFSEIYTHYYKSSFLFVKSYIFDIPAAEDIVSETLINLWQVAKTEKVEFPKALLLKMLKNNALNYLKHQDMKQSAMEKISSVTMRDLNYRVMSLKACEPEELFAGEIVEIVEKTLQALPLQTRRIFEMSRFENLSVKEIAETLDINPKTVEYHITKSLKAFRITLKDYLSVFILLSVG
ncbi:MAG: RNA polymerase sigma-70 factor [Dysgonamonadaceae bacterium]|nr:RNA polymerase sigma-70 factor [Dysgonamonadaceae bacterium]